MLVPFRQMWCLSEPNIDGFFLSSLILQFGLVKQGKGEEHSSPFPIWINKIIFYDFCKLVHTITTRLLNVNALL